jgi:pyridoxal phosphate enzyme (YggS family)
MSAPTSHSDPVSAPLTSAERLADVRARMANACALANREPDAVRLIAVSKTFAAAEIQPMIDAGQRVFGENRVQESQSKWPALRALHPDLELHLIGQLQSNKAAEAVGLFDAIHTVDRPSLIKALGQAMTTQQRRPWCLVQVNIGEEPQKGGCAIADTAMLVEQARAEGLDIRGLMAIPPAGLDPAPFFALLHKMTREVGLRECSMGMSDDFETAVQLGSTMVRVGSALFGARSVSA